MEDSGIKVIKQAKDPNAKNDKMPMRKADVRGAWTTEGKTDSLDLVRVKTQAWQCGCCVPRPPQGDSAQGRSV